MIGRAEEAAQAKPLHKPKRFGIILMPTVLRFGSMRFEIHLRNEHEPPHVHVDLPDGEVVVVLDELNGTVSVRDKDRDVRAVDVARTVMIVTQHFDVLLELWSYYHR